MAKSTKHRGGRKKGSRKKKSSHRKKGTHRKAPRKGTKRRKSGGRKKGSRKAPRRKSSHKRKSSKKGSRRKGGRKKQSRNPGMTAAHYAQLAVSEARQAAKSKVAKLEKEVKACKRKVDSLEDKLSAAASRAPRAAKKGKKKSSKRRARPGTKSKACKPFAGRRKKPVKCRTKPSAASLAGCGTAAERYGENKRELCGPGTPRKPGKSLAEHRWHGESGGKKKSGKRRNGASVHDRNFWGN